MRRAAIKRDEPPDCALAVGICAQHLRHVPDGRRLGFGLAPLGGHLSAFCLERHEIVLSRLRSSTSAARAFIWLSIADRAVPVLPRLAATSIAGFMRVLDALWVGLEGYKPHLPQRGRAHQKRACTVAHRRRYLLEVLDCYRDRWRNAHANN
jgi:hypothetical protein